MRGRADGACVPVTRCTKVGVTRARAVSRDGRGGYFVNAIDFPRGAGRLRGFRVVVKGKRLSDNEVQLYFRRDASSRRRAAPSCAPLAQWWR